MNALKRIAAFKEKASSLDSRLSSSGVITKVHDRHIYSWEDLPPFDFVDRPDYSK